MCVNAARSEFFDRAEFFGILTAAALPLMGAAAPRDASAFATPPPVMASPRLPAVLGEGNLRATIIARTSPFVQRNVTKAFSLAGEIGDAPLRQSVLDLMNDPRPAYARSSPDLAARAAVRDKLAAAGFVAQNADVAGIFPAGTEPDAKSAPQPFWAAAGSYENSHHAYPGGLATHEACNASMAGAFASTYDERYFNGRATTDRDTVIAAALYHDIMKSVVFQWNPDGTLFKELEIAGTGGHHVLSGAEAIARGRTPRFVIALLSAHAAPSLGDEKKVVGWCHAAAIVAGVDPVEFGLLKRDGTGYALAPAYVPAEAFINHLSDHDYVLSVHAMQQAIPQLRSIWTARALSSRETFAWFKNRVLANISAIALYQTLATGGDAALAEMLEPWLQPPSSIRH